MADIQIPREAVDAAARALGNHIELDFDVLPADEQHQAREAAIAALNAAAPLILAAATGDATAIYARVCSAELVERLGRDGLERLVREVLAAVRKAGVDEPAESAAPLLADTEIRNEMLAEIECLRANLAKTRKALFAVEYIASDDWGSRGGGSDLPSWDADEIAQIADAGGRDIEHTSTCATSKAPAEKPGPCDCQTEAGA